LLKAETGILGIITSDAYQNAPYAQKSREMLCKKTSFIQIDFFDNVRLFSDAAVNNIIFITQNKMPNNQNLLKRFWHKNVENISISSNEDEVNQVELDQKIFRQMSVDIDVSQTILLDDIVYISEGMNLASHDKKYPGEFTKDELLSDVQDEQHPVKFIEGRDIGKYQIFKIRYLEYGKGLRAPLKIRRPTFPALYKYEHIVAGHTSGITIVTAGFFNPNSVRTLLPWFRLVGVENRSVPSDLVELKKDISKRFSLQYLVAILNSSIMESFIDAVGVGTRDETLALRYCV
jgi:type I restriction enzyme M protein